MGHVIDPSRVARRMAESRPLAAAIRLFDIPVSVVGGFVRDALLDRPHGPDIDLVVEGDAIAVARRVGRALGAMMVPHEQFGTATLELPHGGEMDFVTARRERYAHPGALPEVEPGTLADDLARRDIGINAMAFRLSGPRAGELVDPHGGIADLGDRRVRIIRDDAFLEDPSRVVRAARYAARLDFAMEPVTARRAVEAAGGVTLQNTRVADEFARLLGEGGATAAAGVHLLAGAGVAWCDPGGPRLAASFAALDAALAHPHAPRIPVWALRLGWSVPVAAIRAAALPGWARGLAEEAAEGPALARRLQGLGSAPSRVDALLGGAKPATVCAALAAGAAVVATWWERWCTLVLAVGGADLVAAGVPPGPAIGRALRATRAAVLDGRATTREEQLRTALDAAR